MPRRLSAPGQQADVLVADAALGAGSTTDNLRRRPGEPNSFLPIRWNSFLLSRETGTSCFDVPLGG